MVQSIEDYSLYNISNRINLRRSQTSILYIRFPVFLHWGAMHHVSMYFLRKTVFRFLPREKRSCFRENNTIFTDNTRKIICRLGPFWKDHLFRASGKRKYGFPCSGDKGQPLFIQPQQVTQQQYLTPSRTQLESLGIAPLQLTMDYLRSNQFPVLRDQYKTPHTRTPPRHSLASMGIITDNYNLMKVSSENSNHNNQTRVLIVIFFVNVKKRIFFQPQ